MNSLYNTILSPIVTEKATQVSEKNQFVFKVRIDSNKKEIKKAIEKNRLLIHFLHNLGYANISNVTKYDYIIICSFL